MVDCTNGPDSYTIDDATNPALMFTKGSTYVFTLASNCGSHPFWINTANSIGMTHGYAHVTNNGAHAGSVTVVIPDDETAVQLFYNCQYHSPMTNSIMVGSGAVSSTAPAGPAHTYAVDCVNGPTSYKLDGATNPALTFALGSSYVFNLNDNCGGHPFWINTANSLGTTHGYGHVTNNGANSGAVTVTVPASETATQLFYNCQYHSGMTGAITVGSGGGTVATGNGAETRAPAAVVAVVVAIASIVLGLF